jgi:hypothetical protein
VVEGAGYCEAHRKARRARRRPAENPWRDTPAWPRISEAYRRAHPVCEHPGCTKPTEVIHDRDGRHPDEPGANAWVNLEALCREHHGQRHHEMGTMRRP